MYMQTQQIYCVWEWKELNNALLIEYVYYMNNENLNDCFIL